MPLQTPTFNTTLKGRVLLDLFSEPDIFNIRWDALSQYNGIVYPALPDLYGPTMNVGSPAQLWVNSVYHQILMLAFFSQGAAVTHTYACSPLRVQSSLCIRAAVRFV